jgi:hypothetical protein
MDLSHTHSQQAISPSLPQSTELSSTTQPPLTTHTTTSDSSRTLRSTTRARAAKQKLAKDNDSSDQTTSAPAESSSRQTRSNYHPYPSKRTRDTKGKGKSQEITEEQPNPHPHKKYVSLTHHTYHSRRTLSDQLHILTQRPPYDLSCHFFRSYYQRTHPRHKGQETCCPRNPLGRSFRQCPCWSFQASPSNHNRLLTSFPFRHHTTISIRDAEKIEVMCQFGPPRACLNACLSNRPDKVPRRKEKLPPLKVRPWQPLGLRASKMRMLK